MYRKQLENKKKLEEINKRLDAKAKLLYVAYKNGRLNLDILNVDMKDRILKLSEGEKQGYGDLISKLKDKKIGKIQNAIDNLDNSFDDTDENEEEPELSEKIITQFASFKLI